MKTYARINNPQLHLTLSSVNSILEQHPKVFFGSGLGELLFFFPSSGFGVRNTIDFALVTAKIDSIEKCINQRFLNPTCPTQKIYRRTRFTAPSEPFLNDEDFLITVEDSLKETVKELQSKVLSSAQELFDSLEKMNALHIDFVNEKFKKDMPEVLRTLRNLILSDFQKQFEDFLTPLFNVGIEEIIVQS